MPHPRSVESEIWPEFLNRCVHKLPRWFWCSLEFEHHFSSRFPSVQFSRSVVSNSLRPHGPQHTRPPCPSLTPGIDSDSCPLSQWCHPTISSSVVPFSSRLQSFPASGSFQMSQFFTSGGQSIGVLASASVFREYSGLISFIWTGWICLQSKGLSRVFSNSTVQKHQFFGALLPFLPQMSISYFSLSHYSSSTLISSLSVYWFPLDFAERTEDVKWKCVFLLPTLPMSWWLYQSSSLWFQRQTYPTI